MSDETHDWQPQEEPHIGPVQAVCARCGAEAFLMKVDWAKLCPGPPSGGER